MLSRERSQRRRPACGPTPGCGPARARTISSCNVATIVQLARVFGIRIGVEWSWFVVLFIVIYVLRGYFAQILPNGSQAFTVAVLSTLAFFGSLVAHELGHALVARRLGLQIDGIDLWLFGGFTRTHGEVLTPGGEFSLAAAGPAVTALISLLCVMIGLAFGSLRHLVDVALFDSNVHVTAALALFSWLALINLFLLVFNLVPAFPLDGGRMAQAVAWRHHGDRNRACAPTARIGQVFGWILIATGVASSFASRGSTAPGSGLIGFYLEQAARRAVVQTKISDRLRT
jgi:Zn-dependent protease